MSDATTIGAIAPGRYGAAETSGLALRETTIALAWNLQGDPARPAFAAAVEQAFGAALPTAPNTTRRSDALTLLWLGPASWLLIGSNARGAPAPSEFPASRVALNAAGGALFDLSATRVGWTLSGTHARTILAKGCPLDLNARAFPVGACAQSLYGHVGALVYRGAEDAYTLLVARSFGREVWGMLCDAGAPYGYEVLPPAPFA